MDEFKPNENQPVTPPTGPTNGGPQRPDPSAPPQPTVTYTWQNSNPVSAPPNPYPYYQVPVSQPTDGFGIASMVLGILSVLCCCYGAGLLLAIPALIFGLVAKKSPLTGKRSGYAIAGIVLSVIGIVIALTFLVLFALSAVNPDLRDAWDDVIHEIEHYT